MILTNLKKKWQWLLSEYWQWEVKAQTPGDSVTFVEHVLMPCPCWARNRFSPVVLIAAEWEEALPPLFYRWRHWSLWRSIRWPYNLLAKTKTPLNVKEGWWGNNLPSEPVCVTILVKSLARGCTANKWQSWNLNSRFADWSHTLTQPMRIVPSTLVSSQQGHEKARMECTLPKSSSVSVFIWAHPLPHSCRLSLLEEKPALRYSSPCRSGSRVPRALLEQTCVFFVLPCTSEVPYHCRGT